jgi:hypothetical protein
MPFPQVWPCLGMN